MRTEIIYEDKDIIVVYKPAGLATQTAKLGQADVVSELKNYLAQGAGRDTYVGVIHRLDQPVEGLLVFAKHKKAAADLTAQLQRTNGSGGLSKHYYAVICGKSVANQGRLVDYMYKSTENLAVIVDRGCDKAKEAVLEYQIVKEKQDLALADITIFTGRFHQIRAQMAHGGMPLLGDAKYGSAVSKEQAKTLGVQMVALCAYSLEFQHPITKKTMSFKEEPRGKAFFLFS